MKIVIMLDSKANNKANVLVVFLEVRANSGLTEWAQCIKDILPISLTERCYNVYVN
jgi:hypothetical protein